MNFPKKTARVLIVVILFLAGMMAYLGSTGQLISFSQNVIVTITKPFSELNANISDKISDMMNSDADELKSENSRLKSKITELEKKIVQYDRMKTENEAYKELLGITDTVSEYNFTSAHVIGRDGMSSFFSFTVDRGTADGIEINDVVFTADGVVGVVTDTGLTFSRVSTIASPAVSVGCFVGDSLDTAILTGDYDVSDEPHCIAQYLSKGTAAKEGDLVSTSGYGSVFPADLIIGTVESVEVDSSGNYMTAAVKPAADIANAKVVFIITDYNG